MLTEKLQSVENFWEHHLCGSHFVKEEKLSKAFFDSYRNFRYNKEHHLLRLVDWESARNKDVLEIGLGVGADSTRWAAHAGSFTGIDLTQEAAGATRMHLAQLGLKGNIVCGNAEQLPFADQSFDIVYSQGVLMHTENMDNAFRELHRVLRPDGRFILMFYTRESFNYWVRIQGYFRLRLLFEMARRKLGLTTSNSTWQAHLKNVDKQGWNYLSWQEFPHHCTDGPECTIAHITTKSEITSRLAKHQLRVTKTNKAHFPITGGRWKGLERFLSRYVGFYMFYEGVKI